MTIGAVQISEIFDVERLHRRNSTNLSDVVWGIAANNSRIYMLRQIPKRSTSRYASSPTLDSELRATFYDKYIYEYNHSGTLLRYFEVNVPREYNSIALYDDRFYISHYTYADDGDSRDGLVISAYNLSGQRIGTVVNTTDIETGGQFGLAVTSSRIFYYQRIRRRDRSSEKMYVFSSSGTRMSSEDFTTSVSLSGVTDITATESRIFIYGGKAGRDRDGVLIQNNDSGVEVYTHGGQLKSNEGVRIRRGYFATSEDGIDVTKNRLFICARSTRETDRAGITRHHEAIIPYAYTPTSDSDFPDETVTIRDFAPGDDVIFQISSSPAPSSPVEVMYTITSDGGIIDPAQEGRKMITIATAETTITIPTLTSGVEQGYFIRIMLTQGDGYQLGATADIVDQVGEEIIG